MEKLVSKLNNELPNDVTKLGSSVGIYQIDEYNNVREVKSLVEGSNYEWDIRKGDGGEVYIVVNE